MKIEITLTESEVKDAIANAINDKMEWNGLNYSQKVKGHQILLNGSVKFKSKHVRKEVKRIIASAVVSK